ncbi:Larval/pupal rigid cuticle protein 66 [Papilio xuthus]|uniref:Larval/pupal rigid cuticle protein 66 n=1 Tax=Papilio xuthus TaxID=66420 RepID=A0A194PPC5_PAPXU|nr:Larval/pupal rigid cuticle protein 66 [Papilio xuthus]
MILNVSGYSDRGRPKKVWMELIKEDIPQDSDILADGYFVILFALVAVACASDFSSFSYGVADPYTGDYKSQIESRAGDRVRGQYSLLDADGTRRTVDYAAGAEGFNANVRKDPALIPAATAAYAAPVYPYGYGYPYGYNNLAYGYNNLGYGYNNAAYGYGAYGYAGPYAFRRFY